MPPQIYKHILYQLNALGLFAAYAGRRRGTHEEKIHNRATLSTLFHTWATGVRIFLPPDNQHISPDGKKTARYLAYNKRKPDLTITYKSDKRTSFKIINETLVLAALFMFVCGDSFTAGDNNEPAGGNPKKCRNSTPGEAGAPTGEKT